MQGKHINQVYNAAPLWMPSGPQRWANLARDAAISFATPAFFLIFQEWCELDNKEAVPTCCGCVFVCFSLVSGNQISYFYEIAMVTAATCKLALCVKKIAF